MVKRSLQASLPGIQQAKQAFENKGWTQESLAGEVGLKTRQPIWRFFTGQPVDRHFFLEVCSLLGLDWREIASNPPAEFSGVETTENSVASIDTLVHQVRLKRQDRIQDRCGALQLLDINYPVKIDDIYTNVNVLKEIPSQRWIELSNLEDLTPNELEHFELGEGFEARIEGMKAVKSCLKLCILGNPGSGKTTFLNYLAIQCDRGNFAANRVPIFVALKDFADESRAIGEFDLLSYIGEEFFTSGVLELSVLETLLREGRALVLLDGLDEVLYSDRKIVAREVRRLSEKYHQNIFVVTRRTAAKIPSLVRFTEVEIAPLASDKIVVFAQKWFTTLTQGNREAGQKLAARFIEQLDLPENTRLRDLVTTPLCLHLACLIFLHQQKFPTKRSQFLKECLELLLRRWDETKGIDRDEIYRSFSLPHKLKLLSQIATATFEQGHYFFEQDTVEQYIQNYLQGLPNASMEPEELQVESEAIFRTIALHHGLLVERARGIFSFSHLAFQEYFTARKIVDDYKLHALEQSLKQQPLKQQPLKQLVNHIAEPRWREIFLLVTTMLPDEKDLLQLMEQKVEAIAAQDPKLQEAIVNHCAVEYEWQLGIEQQRLLQHYNNANQLLSDCVNLRQ